ncbi:transporter [Marinobacterium nitratireducens]|uniref:Transporter n=1 Tax=Marinobacterium nitratireducens TaxID=518897 RepID=A0A917ZHP3_9GAMM|nr:sodium-dependent transporter [Marinobacterium nitratireducens]GGO82988.1 transporter [Marinobacterium nitratireducens]
MSRTASGLDAAGAATPRPQWSSRLAFILAATGSAVGLGNIWKFPYITGENGGGAFVLVYLACIAVVGLPILAAEVLLGRRGRHSPVRSMAQLAKADGASPRWGWVAWMGFVAAFVLLSFYSVVGGWSLAYIGHAVSGDFGAADAEAIGALFGGLLGSPGTLLLWHSVFMLMVVAIVGAGVNAGMERAINLLMPLLFVLLLVLVGYAMAQGDFARGVDFLFAADFSKLSTEGVLTALGHAFFTLSTGICVMMAYGSFLPREVNIARTVITIGVLDTLVALLAGLAIFPLVFANGLEPGAGPGLLFVTLPLAFGQMTGGVLFGSLFFFLLLVAAITSAISMIEPVVEWLEDRGVARKIGALLSGALIWALGICTVLSFNHWADFHPLAFIGRFEGKTLFDLFDFLVSNLALPLGGMAIALYAGWVMKPETLRDLIGLGEGLAWALFRFVLRFLSPAAVLVVFIYNLV